MREFLKDEGGHATTDFVVVFLPVMLFVLTICELAIAFHFTASAQKSAQLGARLAAAQAPVHRDVWPTNRLDPANGAPGDACYQPTGDACVDPGVSWVCDGAALDARCDAQAFVDLVSEVRRLYPAVVPSDVRISYVYRRLGVAGGPFVPEVAVSIRERAMPVEFLSLLGLLRLRETTASVIGEDMAS